MAKKKKKSSFRGKVNSDAKRQKNAGAAYGYLNLPKGVSVYAPKAGNKEKIDIIPYTISDEKHPDKNEEYSVAMEGDLWYKRPFRVHRSIGADNDSAVCLTSFGKKCPICEYRKERQKEDADQDELKAYNSSRRNLYLVIPRDIRKFEEEVHIFDMSQYLFQDLLNDELEEDEDYEVFPDLEEGLTLQIRWNEESFAGNKYAEAGRIDFKKRKGSIDEELLENLPDLDTVLKELSYDELKAKFFESESESNEGDGEDDTPKKSSKSRKKKGSKKKKEKQLEWDDIIDMGLPELQEVIDAKNLDIDAKDHDDVQELQELIAEELGIDIPKKKAKKKAKKKKVRSKKDEGGDDLPF